MKCNECGCEMILDDKDLGRKGHIDNYYVCNNCRTSCIEQIRCYILMGILWHTENNDIVKDYITDSEV